MPLSVTSTAAAKIKALLVENNLPENAGIRVSVLGGGCSGFEYKVSLAKPSEFDLPKKQEKIFLSEGIRIIVDSKSMLFVDGTVIDWKQHNLGYSFVFGNPNAKGTCGCGTSFSID